MPDAGYQRSHLPFLKRLALEGLALRCRMERRRSKPSAIAKRQVAIVEPYGMGDVIALEPLVASLAASGWEVAVLAQERWRSVLPQAEIVVLEKTWHEMGLAGFLRYARKQSPELRKRFEGAIGIDPRGDARSILFLILCGCAEVYAVDHFIGSDARVPGGIARLIPERSTELMRWQNNLEFLECLGIPAAQARAPRLEQVRGKNALSTRRIGLVAVAPWEGRLWQPEKWSAVIDHLLAEGFEPVLVCGPGQEREARVQAGGREVEVAVGKDVPGLAAAIDGCAAIITLDSGPMHLASALDKPLVALFGPGQRPLWEPFSTHRRLVVSPLAKSGPIHQVAANIPIGKKMMEAIPAEAVIEAFQQLVNDAQLQGKRQDRISVAR